MSTEYGKRESEHTTRATCTCGWCGEVRKLGKKFVDSSSDDALKHIRTIVSQITSSNYQIFTEDIVNSKEALFRDADGEQHKISIVTNITPSQTSGEVIFLEPNQ